MLCRRRDARRVVTSSLALRRAPCSSGTEIVRRRRDAATGGGEGDLPPDRAGAELNDTRPDKRRPVGLAVPPPPPGVETEAPSPTEAPMEEDAMEIKESRGCSVSGTERIESSFMTL